MVDIAEWLSGIEAAVTALGTEHALGIAAPASRALHQATASGGFPGIVPLWTGRRNTVGLSVDPIAPPQQWAGVLLADGEGLTISSDARTLLPQLLVLQMSRFPDRVSSLTGRWVELEARAAAVHRALGGADDTLRVVVNIAMDYLKRSQFEYSAEKKGAFEAAHSAVCRGIDPSKTFQHYADWLDACVEGRPVAPDSVAEYGAWGRRVHCWAARRQFSHPSTPVLPGAWLQQLIEERAGLDSGVFDEPSWSIQPGGASSETMLTEAAMSTSHAPPSTDAVGEQIRDALLKEGASYRGLAHAEAVPILAQSGEAKRAWGILLSAAWWAARNTGEAPSATLDGARLLADRHGWSDVRWVVDRAAGAGS